MYSVEEMCLLLCNKIYSSTREGYGIFYEDELLDVLPAEARTREALEAALKQLMNEGCIDVKYAKGNAFCIMGLKNYEPPSPAALAVQTKSRRGFKTVALIFASSFFGGLLGSFICGIIFYAV